jgi:hypothetical protein
VANPSLPPQATFVLSTGRCGTQWLAHAFAGVYGDCLRVEHEPLHDRYFPRQMLGWGDFAGLPAGQAEPILDHVTGIEKSLAAQPYFETGHPCWSSLPCLARRLAGRIRVVHLVRHPVPTAYSWISNGAYMPPILPHIPAKEFLSPFDRGVKFSEYRDRWHSLQPWEKCLYYWAEVNAFGLFQEQRLGVPWLRINYEHLFAPGPLARLAAFIGLPNRPALAEAIGQRIDEHRFVTDQRMDPRQIRTHPRVIEVAESLGYEVNHSPSFQAFA